MGFDLGQAYLLQAQADWVAGKILKETGQSASQWLHLLQMAVEKLGKAYLAAGGATLDALRSSHLAFVAALRKLPQNQGLAGFLGVTRQQLRS